MKTPAICYGLLFVLATSIVLSQTSGTATGTLTLNGKGTKLSSAQALQAEDWVFGSDHKPVLSTVVRLFLSDVSADDLDDNFELSVSSKAGKLHGVLLTISKKGEILSGSIYHSGCETGVESIFPSRLRFDRKTLDNKVVSGKAQSREPMDISAGKLEFTATFTAPFLQEPKPTVEGPAASETAPAKLVQEFIQAAEAGDAPAVKRVVRKEVAEMLEKPEGKDAVMGMLGQSYPAGKKINIVRVFDFGNRAWVEGESQREGEGGKPIKETYRIRAIKVNNEWKVSPL